MGSEIHLTAGHSAGDGDPDGREPAVCVSLVTSSPIETEHVGCVLGRLVRPGDLVLLQGPLGAGKTCLARGIARGLGFTGRVTSPSFTLANIYEPTARGYPLYHLDLWRIKSAAEALGIGLEEYLNGPGPTVIEWPEVAEAVLPGDFLRIRFEPVDDCRRLEICAFGERPRALLDALREALAVDSVPGGPGASRD